VAVLVGVQGAGLFAAGLFRLDPADGFPPGTPAGMRSMPTWHSNLHNMAGSISFLAHVVDAVAVEVGPVERGAGGLLAACAFAWIARAGSETR
jgi:hypothetical protein